MPNLLSRLPHRYYPKSLSRPPSARQSMLSLLYAALDPESLFQGTGSSTHLTYTSPVSFSLAFFGTRLFFILALDGDSSTDNFISKTWKTFFFLNQDNKKKLCSFPGASITTTNPVS